VRTVRLRFDPATPPSANPQIDALSATIEGADQPIGDTADVTLPRREKTELHAAVAEAAAETYPGKRDDGTPADVRERVFLTWFVETGDTDDERTSFIEGDVPFERLRVNKWEPAATKDYAKDTARLIVIIRDNRGGVGWRSGIVRLGETP
jgi:hypothetical protein